MPKDKRLLVTRAIVQHIGRKIPAEKVSTIGLYLQFIVPLRLLNSPAACYTGTVAPNGDRSKAGPSSPASGSSSSTSDFAEKLYELPNSTYPSNGRSTCLIVSHDILLDALKINKRYKYFDAVISIKSLSKNGGEECLRKAVQASQAFQRFAIDKKVVNELPRALYNLIPQELLGSNDGSSGSVKKAAHAAVNAKPSTGLPNIPTDGPAVYMSPATKSIALVNLDKESIEANGGNLVSSLQIAANGTQLFVQMKDGRCLLRVGHAGMTAGDITANVAQFTTSVKNLFPTLYRSITEFKLVSPVTEPIRYMATNAA
jgi:hypothetical protein